MDVCLADGSGLYTDSPNLSHDWQITCALGPRRHINILSVSKEHHQAFTQYNSTEILLKTR